MSMAMARKVWTLRELHSLPDDGNKYELVHGELFVTPPPSDEHETILARLTRMLDPFVAAHGLGLVYHPRAVMRVGKSEVEPDLMVRQPQAGTKRDWELAPIPVLVVEVLSDSTRRRDREQKKQLYMEAGVAEYWIVDPDGLSVTVVKPGKEERVERDVASWAPPGVSAVLDVRIVDVLHDDPSP